MYILKIGPTDLWVVNRLKDTPGRKLAQYLNGLLKGRKMYIVKIGPSTEWAVNRPESHRADIEPKYIAGCYRLELTMGCNGVKSLTGQIGTSRMGRELKWNGPNWHISYGP